MRQTAEVGFCGGEAMTRDSTSAACAGTTFITTDDGYTALPPGTYRPTRSTGTQRSVTVPPGTTSVTVSVRRCSAWTLRVRSMATSSAARTAGSSSASARSSSACGNAHRGGAHAVELLAVVEGGVGTALADVVDDGTDLMEHRVHVHSASGQRAPQLRGGGCTTTQVGAGKHEVSSLAEQGSTPIIRDEPEWSVIHSP